jgi:hypothetical protein
MAVQLHHIRKIQAPTAAEVCGRVGLSAQAMAYLTPTLSPQGFLAQLEGAGLGADAVRFLAFALPAREGVWWAVMAGAPLVDGYEADPCYEAAQAWVYEPNEERRFACLAAAEAVNSSTPGAYAALGAFWSSGSMSPPDLPEALPDPKLSPTGVSASILLAVAAADPKLSVRHLREALAQGIDIGNGGDGRAPTRPRAGAAA